MSREKPQAQTPDKHPERYQQDLNPNAMAGQNIGSPEVGAVGHARTAYDHKEAHRNLAKLTDDNLRQIRVLGSGNRLEQGATYADLHHLDRGEFTATGDMQIPQGDLYVAKKDVPYNLWNVLIGVTNPERLPDSSDRGAV